MAELSTIDAVFLPKSGLVFTPDLARQRGPDPSRIPAIYKQVGATRFTPPLFAVFLSPIMNLRTALG